VTHQARTLQTDDNSLVVELADGRSISAPLVWYPRLLHSTNSESSNWRLIGAGQGIHCPDLEEDIIVENLLLGKPSGESPKSLQRWLEGRN
jgi:hypothetical protein